MSCPAGYDQGIWDIARFYKTVAEGYKEGTDSLPLLYLKIKERVDKSSIREHNEWVRICKQMVQKFWDDCVDTSDSAHAINQFVHLNMFNDLLEYVLLQRETAWLLKYGKRVKLPGFNKIPVPQPPRGHVRRCYK